MAFEGFSITPRLLFTNDFSISETIQELCCYITKTTKKPSTLSLYFFSLRSYFHQLYNLLYMLAERCNILGHD